MYLFIVDIVREFFCIYIYIYILAAYNDTSSAFTIMTSVYSLETANESNVHFMVSHPKITRSRCNLGGDRFAVAKFQLLISDHERTQKQT